MMHIMPMIITKTYGNRSPIGSLNIMAPPSTDNKIPLLFAATAFPDQTNPTGASSLSLTVSVDDSAAP